MKATFWLARRGISGIITTILGKTATFTEGAGRERRVHHSKKPASPLCWGEVFFSLKNVTAFQKK
jgi:hypothetical protein